MLADPSFAVLENGTTIIAYRGTQCVWRSNDTFREVVSLLVAPHWQGPYRRLGVPIFGALSDNEGMHT